MSRQDTSGKQLIDCRKERENVIKEENRGKRARCGDKDLHSDGEVVEVALVDGPKRTTPNLLPILQ